MFVDRARIRVIAGAGGNGCTSFRREKFIPRGGPDGGDGGDGGSVYFQGDSRLTSLLDLRYHSTWKGNRGAHGMGKDQHGRRGEELCIPVPLGSLILDSETGEPIGEVLEEGQRVLAAKGGIGGKGNARFLSNRNRAPKFSLKGEPGEDREFQIELKVIAEVGLVGLPNAGKSTFLAAVTAAKPKIADYPFTTLSPNLGVAPLSGYRTLTVADIPGIIEGASEGKGLGHDFLRHIERTKVLLFVIDLGDPNPAETLSLLENELAQHSEVFLTRPKFIAFNKADVTENRARYHELEREFPDSFLISGFTGEGMDELLDALYHAVERVRKQEAEGGGVAAPETDYVYEAPFTIEREGAGFRIEGKTVLRAVRMTEFSNEQAVHYLHTRLSKMGLFKALKRMGAKEGETIYIGDLELEYVPE